MMPSKSGLKFRKKAVCSKVLRQLTNDNSLHDLRHEGEVRDRSIILHIAWIQTWFLQCRCHNGSCLGRRQTTLLERGITQSCEEWKQDFQKFFDEESRCWVQFTALWSRSSNHLPHQFLEHNENDVNVQVVEEKEGGCRASRVWTNAFDFLFHEIKKIRCRECWEIGWLLGRFTKNSRHGSPELLRIGWIRLHRILPVGILLGFKSWVLLSQSIDPSEPVCRILGTAISTLQESDSALDRSTFGVEPGSRRTVSRGYVVQRSKTIESISNCCAVEIKKFRGRYTCVVFLILAQRSIRQYCAKTPLDPVSSVPALSEDVNTGLAGHAYGTVHVIKPWSEMVGGSTIKLLTSQSDRVMTTSRIPPAEWVGASTCWTNENDFMSCFVLMQSPSVESSRWTLRSPIMISWELYVAKVSRTDLNSLKKLASGTADPGR